MVNKFTEKSYSGNECEQRKVLRHFRKNPSESWYDVEMSIWSTLWATTALLSYHDMNYMLGVTHRGLGPEDLGPTIWKLKNFN